MFKSKNTYILLFKWLRRVSFNYKWKCTGSRICVARLTERSGIWTWKRWFSNRDSPPIQDLNVDDRHRLWTLAGQWGSCLLVTGSCLLIALPLPQPKALHFRRPRNHVLDSCAFLPPTPTQTSQLAAGDLQTCLVPRRLVCQDYLSNSNSEVFINTFL